MAKEFNSVNYWLVTVNVTEHPVNVISSVVRKSVVSYRTVSYRTSPVDFDIVVQTINVSLLCTYRCVSFKIPHYITPPVISILELPLHSARSPATLSVCSSHHQPHHYLPHQHTNSQKYVPHQYCHDHCYYHHHHLHHHLNQLCSHYHHH